MLTHRRLGNSQANTHTHTGTVPKIGKTSAWNFLVEAGKRCDPFTPSLRVRAHAHTHTHTQIADQWHKQLKPGAKEAERAKAKARRAKAKGARVAADGKK